MGTATKSARTERTPGCHFLPRFVVLALVAPGSLPVALLGAPADGSDEEADRQLWEWALGSPDLFNQAIGFASYLLMEGDCFDLMWSRS
jgi:hypothetical protein